MRRIFPINKSTFNKSTFNKPSYPINKNSERAFNFLFKPSEWKEATSEAEKLVGYSTSFLSLRCLLSDELSNVALNVKKLVGTGHPLLKTAQKLFQEGKDSKELRGLLILLLSKAAGPTKASLEKPQSIVSGIYQSQRTLAEVTEIIHTVSLFHRSVIDLDHCLPDDDVGGGNEGGGGRKWGAKDKELEKRKCLISYNDFQGTYNDLKFGNKMAILSGDFLLASAATNLASLNNPKVVEIISTALQDLWQGEFVRITTQTPIFNSSNSSTHPLNNQLTNQNQSLNHDQPINQPENNTSQPPSSTSSSSTSLPPSSSSPISIKNWEEFTFLISGSLLARGCQSALELANHRTDAQDSAFHFGRLMSLAYHLKEEIRSLSTPPDKHTNPFFSPIIVYTNQVLNSLPHDQNTHEDRQEALRRIYSKSPKEVYALIESNIPVMEEVRQRCEEYGRQAIETLNTFKPTPAKTLLVNMVNAVIKL